MNSLTLTHHQFQRRCCVCCAWQSENFLQKIARSVAATPRDKVFARWYNSKAEVEDIRTFDGIWSSSGEVNAGVHSVACTFLGRRATCETIAMYTPCSRLRLKKDLGGDMLPHIKKSPTAFVTIALVCGVVQQKGSICRGAARMLYHLCRPTRCSPPPVTLPVADSAHTAHRAWSQKG